MFPSLFIYFFGNTFFKKNMKGLKIYPRGDPCLLYGHNTAFDAA